MNDGERDMIGLGHLTVQPENHDQHDGSGVETVNDVPDPAAVLAIPCDDDVPIIRALLEDAYDEIEDYYVAGESTPRSVSEFDVLREGSLYQELIAQLNEGDA